MGLAFDEENAVEEHTDEEVGELLSVGVGVLRLSGPAQQRHFEEVDL